MSESELLSENEEADHPAYDTGASWWERPDLAYREGRLHLGTCDLSSLADRMGTPTYVIRAPRVSIPHPRRALWLSGSR